MESALAMRSLVRRGLVRLEPVPRLMNDSFAAFVRQAERPQAIARWKQEVRRSRWERFVGVMPWLTPVVVGVLILLGWLAGVTWDKVAFALLGVVPSVIRGAVAAVAGLSTRRLAPTPRRIDPCSRTCRWRQQPDPADHTRELPRDVGVAAITECIVARPDLSDNHPSRTNNDAVGKGA